MKGTVTFDGAPMAGGGAISFVPTSSQKGKAADGTIEPDGTFVLSTNADGEGSMVGTLRFVINQTTVQEPDSGEAASTEPSMVLSLATASALFHAVEYLALMGWAVNQRSVQMSTDKLGIIGWLAPRWALTLIMFIVILGSGGWIRICWNSGC